MQSFQTTFDAHSNGGDAAGIHFAPYLATNLIRAFIIHSNAGDLQKSESIFSSLPGFCLIGWQMNRNVAVKDIIQLRPELIVVYSACISNLDFALIRAIKEEVPATNFVFISSEPKVDDLKKLFLAGANGYCRTTDETRILSLAFIPGWHMD